MENGYSTPRTFDRTNQGRLNPPNKFETSSPTEIRTQTEISKFTKQVSEKTIWETSGTFGNIRSLGAPVLM